MYLRSVKGDSNLFSIGMEAKVIGLSHWDLDFISSLYVEGSPFVRYLEVKRIQLANAVLVCYESDSVALIGHREGVHIPGYVIRETGRATSFLVWQESLVGEIVVSEMLKLAAFIRGKKHAL